MIRPVGIAVVGCGAISGIYFENMTSRFSILRLMACCDLKAELAEAVSEAFNNRELIKLAVLKNCFDEPKELAQTIAERTHSQVVQVIGKKIVLYKPDRKDPKIILPR